MISNCEKCVFSDTYRDMSASFKVCTFIKDLEKARAEFNFYARAKCCKYYLSLDDLRSFCINNDMEDVEEVFNYITVNKE